MQHRAANRLLRASLTTRSPLVVGGCIGGSGSNLCAGRGRRLGEKESHDEYTHGYSGNKLRAGTYPIPNPNNGAPDGDAKNKVTL